MAYEIDFVDDTGSEGSAHWQMLLKIKALAEANGWTTLRYDDTLDKRELIMKGEGLSGTEEIFVGFRAYQNASADYYNLSVAGFTGYVAGNTFENQPGYRESGVCAHNNRIDYWLAANAQRIFFGLKVGTPVYEVAYVGKFLPYATPSQYPYPIAVIGTLPAATPATRFSDTSSSHTSGVKGNSRYQGTLRDVLGQFQPFECLPWSVGPETIRDTGGYYSALKAVLFSGSNNNPGGSGNVWGELDGIRYISGFNNTVENTVMIDGKSNVVMQDVFRTGIGDYMLLEMN